LVSSARGRTRITRRWRLHRIPNVKDLYAKDSDNGVPVLETENLRGVDPIGRREPLRKSEHQSDRVLRDGHKIGFRRVDCRNTVHNFGDRLPSQAKLDQGNFDVRFTRDIDRVLPNPRQHFDPFH
jgi:hypothetical protein